MKEIILTDGQKAQVDDEDFKHLNQFEWRAEKHGKTYYAVTDMDINGKITPVTMHDYIMKILHPYYERN